MNVSTAWLKLAISLTLYNISVNNINALILISSSFMVRRLLHCSTRWIYTGTFCFNNNNNNNNNNNTNNTIIILLLVIIIIIYKSTARILF